MGRKIVLILLVTAAMLCSTKAQTHKIVGKITDAYTKKPIPYVAIGIEQLGKGAITNESGIFTITKIPGGPCKLIVSHVGYKIVQKELHLTGDTLLSIALEPEVQTMDEVVVTATVANSAATTSRIDKKAMEHLQPTNLGELLSLLPGQLSSDPVYSASNHVSMRQAGSGKE